MKRNWQPEELIEHWTLLPQELALLNQKKEANRLGFALLLKFYQYKGQFPANKGDIPKVARNYVAQQLKIKPNTLDNYNFDGRTIKAHRVAIREYLGFHEATLSDQKALKKWLEKQVMAYDLKVEALLVAASTYLHSRSIEPPTSERLERIVRSAIHRFEENFFATIAQKLSKSTKDKLDQLLMTASEEYPDEATNAPDKTLSEEKSPQLPDSSSSVGHQSPLSLLKSDPGRLGLDSWTKEAEKLEQLRQLDLPTDLFREISPKVLEIYKQRVAVEPPRELRRHPDKRRYTLLAAFCWLRLAEITDNLVELLIQIVHRIGARAERKVEKELLDDFKKVSGKTGLLFQLAEAALEKPEGTVKEVIYPVVGETTLQNLVREFK